MIGKILANRYRIGERIGGGGMALVYRAEDLQLGRDVAIKVLRGQFGSDEEFVRRFRREAQNAASLSHPNVVQIYDVGQEDDQYYIVMELVEGRTLKALIQAQGPLPVAEAARIAADILGALSHAHHNRIVHRDIKPHNILIAKDGRVKVTDFGIARATTTDTVTHTGSIMGSAHYFSPEQANGQPTGEKADIYSLGVVLYEMVTGVVPFQGESPITVALKHIRDRVVPPSQLNPEVPAELESIILQALEKDPDDRFPSAEAMRGTLLQFVQDHVSGMTHIVSGDFPTMDLRGMKGQRVRSTIDSTEEPDVHRKGSPAQSPRKRSLAWLWISLVTLVVVGVISTAVWALMDFVQVPDVAVPDVRNMALSDAQVKLKEYKLFGEVQRDQFSDLPVNYVISTDPEPNKRVKQNRTIYLIISKGSEELTLPDVRGKTEQNAKADLENAKLKVGRIDRRHSQEPEGQVIDMTPQPLIKVKPGAEVQLVVSLGPVKVPKVVGLSLEEATRAIEAAGLQMGKVQQMPDPTRPKDQVIASDPPEGFAVPADKKVNLVVAQGPIISGRPFEKLIQVPGETGKRYSIKITLVDVVAGIPSEKVLESSDRVAGQVIRVSGTYYGDAYLRVTLDGHDAQRIELP